MDRWKSRGGKSQRREEKKREDQRRERVRRKKMQMRKGRKVAIHCVFPSFSNDWWLRMVESRLAKAAGAQMRDENVQKHLSVGFLEVEMLKKCTQLWREAHFQVNMYKTHHSQTTFGS